MTKGSYCYPNVSDDPDQRDVLRNKLEIRSLSELHSKEYGGWWWWRDL